MTSDGWALGVIDRAREERRVSSLHLVSRGHRQTPPTLTGTCVFCAACVSHLVPPTPSTPSSCWPPSLIFLLFLSFRVLYILLLFCSFFSHQNTSLTYSPPPGLSPFISFLSFARFLPLSSHASFTFICVTQHLDFMLVSVRVSVWHCDVTATTFPS